MRVAAYMYMYIGGGCTEPAELARKAAEWAAEWAAEGEGGQSRNTPGVTVLVLNTARSRERQRETNSRFQGREGPGFYIHTRLLCVFLYCIFTSSLLINTVNH